MKLTNENALIASLLGSKVVEQIPRFAAVQNEISKHVLPPVRFLPILNQPVNVHYPSYEVQNNEDQLWRNDQTISEDNQFFPFSFRSSKDENWYLLPWEPMLNIEGANIIVKRNIAKAGKNLIGSIKERWSTDDYQITITGAFYGDKMLGKSSQTYPRYEMERLRDYLLTAEAIEVLCEPLQILNINKIVIESVSFPFTKGENVQAYEIKALSDFPYNLIYKRKKGILDVGIPIGGQPER
ncbi:hypothetical protein SAMN05421847_2189 [Halpernia humi]|uniref:DUF6046 domain-containing protein n=1 Tax=Halpernia humi TaxID=493375 RepID=A0A1H5ZTJ2_9FLAO|nr:DUF6046 domain-containing protein [Halpernia humi]SEG39472.1 hypothetical protein SAMN05421847_2189 [Halpernia humi]